MKDLSPEEIGRWIDAVPQIVKDAVTGPETEKILRDIGQQYALHVDAEGLLAKLTTYALVGYIGPDIFFKELQKGGISELNARKMMEEINTKVFLPVRKTEESEDKKPTYVASVPSLEKRPETRSAMSPQIVASPSPGQKSIAPPHIAPLPPKTVMPSPGLGDVLRTIMAPKPIANDRLLEDHEEPHIDIKTPDAPAPLPSNEQLQRHEAPVIPQQPMQAPVAKAPIEQPVVPPPPPQQPLAAAPKVPPPPPITSYAKDPYREPIDEEGDK